MVTLDRASFQTQPRYATYVGLAADTKPTGSLVNNGDEFQEIDTGKTYKFDDTNSQWYEQPKEGGTGDYLPLAGGTMDFQAEIKATTQLSLVGENNFDSSRGSITINDNGVTNIQCVYDDMENYSSSNIQVNSQAISFDAKDIHVTIFEGGVSLGNKAELREVKVISGSYEKPNITVKNEIDMNYNKIVNIATPENDGDAMNKGTADTTYVSKTQLATESDAGIVKQAANISDSSGATDVVLEEKFNALLASLRNAGILAT